MGMKFRTLSRHVREGTKNLGRNGWMTFASISAVAVMLFVVGAFILMIMNMNQVATTVEDDVEINVYIELTADKTQQEALEAEIQTIPNIESVTYVSRDEGLDQLIGSLDEETAPVFESLREENPLNDKFVVRATNPQLTEQIADQIEAMNHVDYVRFGREVVNRLFTITNFVRTGGLVLIIGMMLTAMFLISNTIKLTIFARKREIQIMKLVGATNGFIRWPFFIEGILLGVIGALIPIAILWGGYYYVYNNFGGQVQNFLFSLTPVTPSILQVAVVLVAVGAFIGMWGSVMSVRKFLKV